MNKQGGTESHVELKVQKEFNEERRLDQYVALRLPELSRVDVQRLIADGCLVLNGDQVKPSRKVHSGDIIVIDFPRQYSNAPVPEDIPLNILYEDEFMVLLNKQANLIVHPGRGKENWNGTLTNALQFHFEKLSSMGGLTRPGIVHRLDRDTTGVLVVAKDDHAHKHLSLQFEHRQVTKEYLAIVYGVMDRDNDTINKPLGPHPTHREKRAIREDPRISQSATTFYEVLERFEGYTYVKVKPKTGRTHQIRVHLDHVGFPIVADKLYANRPQLCLSDLSDQFKDSPDDKVLIDRQALHAHRLVVRHPRCLEMMDVDTPIPMICSGHWKHYGPTDLCESHRPDD